MHFGAKRRKTMDTDITRKSPLATVEQAVEFLHVSPRTVMNLQARGLLKTVPIGRRRFFTWASLEKIARIGASLK
jgi:hypothetical protein